MSFVRKTCTKSSLTSSGVFFLNILETSSLTFSSLLSSILSVLACSLFCFITSSIELFKGLVMSSIFSAFSLFIKFINVSISPSCKSSVYIKASFLIKEYPLSNVFVMLEISFDVVTTLLPSVSITLYNKLLFNFSLSFSGV